MGSRLPAPHPAPLQGHRESDATQSRPAHDPKCYLCPGNQRSGGAVNPQYPGTFVFPNDYAALLPDVPLTAACPAICFVANRFAVNARDLLFPAP